MPSPTPTTERTTEPTTERTDAHRAYALRMAASRIVALLAIALLLGYTYQIQPMPPGTFFDYEHLVAQTPLVGVGWLVLALAVLLSRPGHLITWQPQPVALSQRVNLAAGVLGALCIVAFTAAHTQHLGLSTLHGLHPDDQFALLVAGCALLVVGLSGGGIRLRAARPRLRLSSGLGWEIGAVVVLMLVGFGLRAWRLNTAVHLFVDEVLFSTAAAIYWQPPYIDIASPGTRDFPFLFSYLQNHFITLLGRDFAGLRMLSVVMGTLTIPAVYLLGRTLFDRPTAYAATIIFATFPPHLQFSRLGLNNIADPLFGTFALAFLALGFKHNRRLHFALAGVGLGLTQYWYEVGRSLFPLLVVLWSAWGLLAGYARQRLRGLVLAAVAATVVALPIYATIYALELPLNPRVEDIGSTSNPFDMLAILSEDTYPERLLLAFMTFVHQPEWGTYYYGGEGGFVLIVFVPLMLLGAGYSLVRPKHPGVVIVGLIVLNAFFTSLIVSTEISARYVSTFPALALLMGLGLRVLFGLLLTPRLDGHHRGPLLAMVVLFSVMMAVAHTLYFFGSHLPTFNEQVRRQYNADAQDAMLRAADYPPAVQAHIIAFDVINENFLNTGLGFFRDNPWGDSIQVHQPGRFDMWRLPVPDRYDDYLFFVQRTDPATAALLDWYFVLGPVSETPHNVPADYRLLMIEAQGRLHTAHAPLGLLNWSNLARHYDLPPHERWLACHQDDPALYPLRPCWRVEATADS